MIEAEQDSIDNFRLASRGLIAGGTRFGAETLDAVNIARRVLDDPEALEDERAGNLTDYSRRILWQHENAQRAIAAGAADLAAVWGFRLGKTLAAAALKSPAKRGRGRPRGSGAVQSDAALLEIVMRAIANGEPGAPAARAALEKRGVAAGIKRRAEYVVRMARFRMKTE